MRTMKRRTKRNENHPHKTVICRMCVTRRSLCFRRWHFESDLCAPRHLGGLLTEAHCRPSN